MAGGGARQARTYGGSESCRPAGAGAGALLQLDRILRRCRRRAGSDPSLDASLARGRPAVIAIGRLAVGLAALSDWRRKPRRRRISQKPIFGLSRTSLYDRGDKP